MDGFHAWWKDILLAGETSPGSGWPEYLPAPFLFEHYSRSIEALGQRVRVLQMLLHEKMRDVLPNSAVRKRRRCLVNIARSGPPHMVNALTNGWVIPSLRECRDAFDAKTGTRTTWPPIEGEDEPRPLEAYYVPPADPAL